MVDQLEASGADICIYLSLTYSLFTVCNGE